MQTVLPSYEKLLSAREKFNIRVGTDQHFLHRTSPSGNQSKVTSTSSPNAFKMPTHASVSVFCFCVRMGLSLLWPFFSPSLRPSLSVPGYSQVSGGRKDLFYCCGSPIFANSQGRGGVAPPLTSVWNWSDHSHVAMLRSTALPCCGVWCPHPVGILSLCTHRTCFTWHCISVLTAHVHLLIPWHVYIRVPSTKDWMNE